MDGIYWLYSIENKFNGKKYIGCTINPSQRWKQHIKSTLGKKTNQYIHKAMRSYGVDNFWFGCIEFCFSEKEALAREKELIKLFGSNNSQYGYNLTEGGEGASGYKHTEKTIKLLSSLASQKVGLLNPFYGKTHSSDTILISRGENNKGAKLTEQKVKDILDSYYTGDFTEEILSQKFGVKRQTINDILRGKRWKHIDRDSERISQIKSLHRKK